MCGCGYVMLVKNTALFHKYSTRSYIRGSPLYVTQWVVFGVTGDTRAKMALAEHLSALTQSCGVTSGQSPGTM